MPASPPPADGREWLVTNGLGGYAMGTVAGPPSRSYHGLLIAALAPPVERTLLVSGLEESVRGVDGDAGGCGRERLVAFALEGSVPRWRYAWGETLLEKRVWMVQGANTTYVSYRLVRGGPLDLTLTACVQHRSHHGGERPRLDLVALPMGVEVRPAAAAPFFLGSDRGDWRLEDPARWVEGIPLAAEAERGLASTAEHLRAATLTVSLGPLDPAVTVVASTHRGACTDGARALGERHDHEQALLRRWEAAQPGLAPEAPAWIRQLVLAADAFVVERSMDGASGHQPGASLIAGYPWFNDWGRDTMISLAGLTLATGRCERAERILRTYAAHVSHGLIPNSFPDRADQPLDQGAYNTVDATLWFFQALAEHRTASGSDALVRELFTRLEAILEQHVAGTWFGIRMDPADGLLGAGEGQTQLTWMDAKPGDRAITPRHGKAVEVNALWVNALGAMAGFARLTGADPGRWRALADRAAAGFQRFWNPRMGGCFDVIDGPSGRPDDRLRPNQLLALSLPEPLLSRAQATSVLALCGRRLLTRHGLRTLDPADPDYRGHYGGDAQRRDGAYHQGTVWAWWLGPFARGHFRLHGDAPRALSYLEPMADHLDAAGVGSLSEIFDGDPPHAPRGCIAQAWSVAQVLAAWTAISDGSAALAPLSGGTPRPSPR
ncbi:amylo-alpha-1,6-glucosidase [Cyanobium gracile]|uniref:Glycogen debranching enzyme n=1 Tax=Cyanobium gracile (strain ATCC 27147 / PCC 6307) TaxID=292564 RepID=K9P968_CYAGP|nr:amylo-alpha-1,6-glucosidase [Cyanobium gracile]AFY29503.1 glycogen debranching enzyme [Cyanobium gracile PCC 6307]